MTNKNLDHQLINLNFLVTLLYIIGMLGVVGTSIYHLFFEKFQVGISPTLVLAFIFLSFILIAVIIAKFSKETKSDSTNTIILGAFSIAIVFILFILTTVSK
ncbi:hypothetical protein [Lactococcus cremoris]|uniref:hypothetical protein n=1 Tax=Lactococcus lactis subsp. cremoris TaxID=1359 RepID=UPI000582F94C|nr:hypothetical protein [Lactococcus cremoris]KGH32437.1 hypothetical protein JL36_13555 [Lactococcus cremoris]QSE64760.1 hypothetical protein JWR96_11975 [Lactococcus cremoris]